MQIGARNMPLRVKQMGSGAEKGRLFALFLSLFTYFSVIYSTCRLPLLRPMLLPSRCQKVSKRCPKGSISAGKHVFYVTFSCFFATIDGLIPWRPGFHSAISVFLPARLCRPGTNPLPDRPECVISAESAENTEKCGKSSVSAPQ